MDHLPQHREELLLATRWIVLIGSVTSVAGLYLLALGLKLAG